MQGRAGIESHEDQLNNQQHNRAPLGAVALSMVGQSKDSLMQVCMNPGCHRGAGCCLPSSVTSLIVLCSYQHRLVASVAGTEKHESKWRPYSRGLEPCMLRCMGCIGESREGDEVDDGEG